MRWQELREQYPGQWVLIEALQAHSEQQKRIVDQLAVINTYPDSTVAMKEYLKLHRAAPEREMYVVHTDREQLDIQERQWVGIRGAR